jgi:phospholipid/cholesterol/gamma-HCH transport system substrate-binding protein
MRRLLHFPSVRDFNKVALGLVAVVIITGIVGGAFAVGTLGLLKHRYQMTGVFTDSGGLKKGAPVRVAGVNVGQVTQVAPDFATGQVIITWEVNNSVHLGPRTRADVGTATLLGGDFIRLNNTRGTPYMRQLPRPTRRIPLERTSVPYTVITAFSDATAKLKQLDIGTVNQIIKQVGSTLQTNSATIPDLVKNFNQLGTAITQRQDELNQLVTNSRKVTATLAARDQQLAQLVDQAGGLLDALNRRRDQLTNVLGTGNDIVKQLNGVLDGKRAQLDTILHDFHTTLGTVQQQLPNINAGLAYAGPTFQRLSSVITPTSFSVEITGIGPMSLSNLNKLLDALLGPR